jgi:hypothetical protein
MDVARLSESHFACELRQWPRIEEQTFTLLAVIRDDTQSG